MKTVKLLVILICFSGCVSERVNDWHEDLDFLTNQLYEKHIDFEKIVESKTFDTDIHDLKNNLSRLKDYEIVYSIQAILAKLNISHTKADIYPYYGLEIPIRFDFYSDGLFITEIRKSDSTYLKNKVIAVNHILINDLIKKLSAIVSHENKYWLEVKFKWFLSFPQILNYLEILNPDSIINFTMDNGDILYMKHENNEEQLVHIDVDSNFMLLKNTEKNYWFAKLNDDILFLQYNSCFNDTNYLFKDFVAEIDTFIHHNSFKKIIIDLRLNNGGYSSIINPLIDLLKQTKNIKKYVCISKYTFSSGVLAAIDLKNRTNAILIGEPTGGAPNGYSELGSFILPNSQLEIHYCKNYTQTQDSDESTLYPDIEIKMLSTDIFNSIDPVIEYIMKDNKP